MDSLTSSIVELLFKNSKLLANITDKFVYFVSSYLIVSSLVNK